jgi:hypothetical protein
MLKFDIALMVNALPCADSSVIHAAARMLIKYNNDTLGRNSLWALDSHNIQCVQ